VKNVGNVEGSDVVQLYISPITRPRLQRPSSELKAFAKVFLKPGESKRVELTVDEEALAYYDDYESKWVSEAGKYQALIAASSLDVKLKVEIEKDVTTKWTGLGPVSK